MTHVGLLAWLLGRLWSLIRNRTSHHPSNKMGFCECTHCIAFEREDGSLDNDLTLHWFDKATSWIVVGLGVADNGGFKGTLIALSRDTLLRNDEDERNFSSLPILVMLLNVELLLFLSGIYRPLAIIMVFFHLLEASFKRVAKSLSPKNLEWPLTFSYWRNYYHKTLFVNGQARFAVFRIGFTQNGT